MKKLVLLALCSLMGVSQLFALTAVQTGSQVEVKYKEPTTNKDGTPLTDLGFTTIYYDVGAGEVVASTVTATDVNGGGNITRIITIPNVPANVDVWATASDLGTKASDKSVIIVIDNMPPSAPE